MLSFDDYYEEEEEEEVEEDGEFTRIHGIPDNMPISMREALRHVMNRTNQQYEDEQNGMDASSECEDCGGVNDDVDSLD